LASPFAAASNAASSAAANNKADSPPGCLPCSAESFTVRALKFCAAAGGVNLFTLLPLLAGDDDDTEGVLELLCTTHTFCTPGKKTGTSSVNQS
jgi:hypothetical protein